ncbi:hypothetical protein JR316_0002902 [Psilocybe cubensis]|uniref:Uncharacterized protein n=2 Tax=Psilocybe cubensis TaxID=181762 RepID=A0ACB8H6T7_PSICU|nr:hypothetical protein JR316_0002902 [Psilocybe cubensis]KAH9483434.1 hypothetical protein JR316_0002902 [Psilocybe cubensis]
MSQPAVLAAATTLTFSLTTTSPCGARTGTLVSRRAASEKEMRIQTPNLITSTSRGVVPHLSRDHHRESAAIKWVNVPFENFLEQNPPLPLLQPGATPLHTLLGFTPSSHLLALTARDPGAAHDMPPNSHTYINVSTLRGVRKLTPEAWREYAARSRPDVVFALSDTPYTDPPYSQKRLTKSIERSTAWLAGMLRTAPALLPPTEIGKRGKGKQVSLTSTSSDPPPPLPPVLVHLAGGTSPAARKAFAASLSEPLYGPEADALAPLRTLDEGVSGYVVDLVPLKLELAAAARKVGASSSAGADEAAPAKAPPASEPPIQTTPDYELIAPLVLSSLSVLPSFSSSSSQPSPKPLIITNPTSPHEMLYYITHLGADMLGASWAQRAADIGVALDFEFPVRTRAGQREYWKREIGHNLYEKWYALDFGAFAGSFRGAGEVGEKDDDIPVCPCAACSPVVVGVDGRLFHGADEPSYTAEGSPIVSSTTTSSSSSTVSASDSSPTNKATPTYRPPHTRAYVHHLLHTHEMGAHALLALHNLAVVNAFMKAVRCVLETSAAQQTQNLWDQEVALFMRTYADPTTSGLFGEAERRWKEVDLARGKGRLAREREKELSEDGKVGQGEGDEQCELEEI